LLGKAIYKFEHLFDLWTDAELYDRMSAYAATSVSDEVTTVGNCLSWLYLGAKMSKGETIRPNERWINDMARVTHVQIRHYIALV
jgi:hypothetical protein